MPRGGLRGAVRGGAPRGGLGRGSAPRGAPTGRGGLPSAPTRGGNSARSRPPAAGAARMLPSAGMSHQQHQGGPSGSQAKPDAYDEYVSVFIDFFASQRVERLLTSVFLFPAFI